MQFVVISSAWADLSGNVLAMSCVSESSSVRGGCSSRASHQSRPRTLTRPAAYARPICPLANVRGGSGGRLRSGN